jgi:hypothetical protein
LPSRIIAERVHKHVFGVQVPDVHIQAGQPFLQPVVEGSFAEKRADGEFVFLHFAQGDDRGFIRLFLSLGPGRAAHLFHQRVA